MDKLTDRFTELWIRHERVSDAQHVASVYKQLIEMYAESWRTYHNIGHIKACLSYFDNCSDHADNSDAIEMAIWFHDCIYSVGATDNEARSRDWFLDVSDNHLPDDFRKLVAELIMDTCHKDEPISSDGKLLSDIDLTSFGLPWEEYLADGKNVQMEFSTLKPKPEKINPDASPKASFLEILKQRDTIYYSPFYLANFEHAAQTNIQQHLNKLSESK